MVLWTGSYELPHHLGIKPHGAYMFACTILNNLGAAGRRMMQMFCHAASPFAGSQLCTWIRDCTEAVVQTPPAIEVPGVGEVQPPEGILWVHPGINVDSRWQAPVGAAQRALDISGAEAFDIAYRLAARSSCQWLHLLGHVMGDAGLGEFWNLIRTAGVPRADYKTSTGPWEDFDALPYRFLTAGPYPPIDDASAWYLRLSIRTSDTDFAGTDADIVPIVDGRRLAALDHGVPPRPPGPGMAPSSTVPELVLGHNDFERGDRAAYVLGPFGAPPTTIELLNDAPDAGQVVMAALDDLWDGVVSAVQSLAATVRNLWGYDADFVDSDHRLLDAGLLEALVDGQARVFVLHCDGGSEGEYLVHGEVRPTGATGNFGNGVPWREYRVRFTQITCLRESQWDRFTPSDEPFVLALAIPHGGGQAVAKWRSEPFADVDSGETRAMSGDLVVRIPQRHGFISVACAVYESDDETPNDRDRLLDQFANQLAGSLEPVDRSFFETLGASIASAWRVDWVDVVTFNRDARVEVRLHGRQVFDRWVGAGESLTWTLQGAQVHTAHVPDVIACGCTTPCGGDLTGQGAP
jgi:hypothetical protein